VNKNKKNIDKIIEIKSSFTGGTLTNFSGIKPIHKFMTKIGLTKLLDTITLKVHHNSKNSTGAILSTIALGVLSGLNRISKIEHFTMDPLLQKLTGIKGKISDAAIIDRLKKFSMKHSSEYMSIIGEISNKVHTRLGTYKDILDLDSSVKTVYGNQQGAEKGFNEKKNHPCCGNNHDTFNSYICLF